MYETAIIFLITHSVKSLFQSENDSKLHTINTTYGRLHKKKLRGIACPFIEALGQTKSLTCVRMLRKVVVVNDNNNNNNNNNSNNNQCSILFIIYQNIFGINNKCV
jgi:hypothetical protein